MFRTQSQLFFQTTHSSRPPLFTHKKIWIINQFPSHLRTIFRKKITSFIDSSYFWTPWGEITTRKSHHYLVAKKDFWQGSSLFLSFSRTLNYLFLNLIKAILKNNIKFQSLLIGLYDLQTGHLRTSRGNFLIEPADPLLESGGPIRHILYRMGHREPFEHPLTHPQGKFFLDKQKLYIFFLREKMTSGRHLKRTHEKREWLDGWPLFNGPS